MNQYDPGNRNLAAFFLLGAFLEGRQQAYVRATNPKQAVTCQECYSVWIPREGLPINYCSKCGEEIDHDA